MKTSLSSQAYTTVWVLLNCGEMKTFWFWWRQCFCMSLFWYTSYLLPGQTLELTRNVDSITFAYPFTSSLYFFLSLLKCFVNVALSLWLNMHSKHSAMQNTMMDCLFDRQTVGPDDYSALGLHYRLVNG